MGRTDFVCIPTHTVVHSVSDKTILLIRASVNGLSEFSVSPFLTGSFVGKKVLLIAWINFTNYLHHLLSSS